MGKDSLIGGFVNTKVSDTSATVNNQFSKLTTYGDKLKDIDIPAYMGKLDRLVYETVNDDVFSIDYGGKAAPEDADNIDLAKANEHYPADSPEYTDIPTFASVQRALKKLAGIPKVKGHPLGATPIYEKIEQVDKADFHDPIDPPSLEPLDTPPRNISLADTVEPDNDTVTFTDPGAPPDISCGTMPTAPTTNEIDIPEAPSFNDVSAPALNDITIPAIPEVSFPSFDGILPTNDLTAPELEFSFEEGTFEKTFPGLTTKIAAILDGTDPMVLSDETIKGIVQSAVEQIEIEAAKTYDEILNSWALKGHELPQGVMIGRLDELRSEQDRSKAGVIRDIGAKQSELALDGMKHALTIGTQYEGMMIEAFNQAQTRAFEAAKITQDAAIALFDANIKLYNSKIDLYKAQASVYESLIRGSIAIYEGYKAQIEGVKAQTEVQKNQVSLYTSRLVANETIAKIYETQMRGLSAKAEVERLKIEIFKSEIAGYTASVNAKTAEISGYDSRVRAELAKAQIASTKSQDYATRIEGIKNRNLVELQRLQLVLEENKGILAQNEGVLNAYKIACATTGALNDAELKRFTGEIELNRMRATNNQAKADSYRVESEGKKIETEMSKFDAEVVIANNKACIEENKAALEAYRDEVMAISALNDGETKRFTAEITGYTETVKALVAEHEGKLKKYEADMLKWETEQKLSLEKAKEQVRIAIQDYELKLRSAETGAKVLTQLAASTFSAVHVGASVGFTGTNANHTSIDRTKSYETFSHTESLKKTN